MSNALNDIIGNRSFEEALQTIGSNQFDIVCLKESKKHSKRRFVEIENFQLASNYTFVSLTLTHDMQ